MMRYPKTGKFERITDVEQIDEALKTDTAFWIYTKDPNVQAFTDLLTRALDKPAEHVHVAGHDGSPLVMRWQRDEDGTLDSASNVPDVPPSDANKLNPMTMKPSKIRNSMARIASSRARTKERPRRPRRTRLQVTFL